MRVARLGFVPSELLMLNRLIDHVAPKSALTTRVLPPEWDCVAKLFPVTAPERIGFTFIVV
jgi:hypothetical protein